jgi:hypothetical protein
VRLSEPKLFNKKICNPRMTGFPVAENLQHVAGHQAAVERIPLYRFFLNLYSTPTEMAKLTSVWVIFDP